ncbi:diphosphoinositol-polyphosphate diphosphatase [Malassezia sp. CBS 17886]|nr:diphosphoinositol-polyphosphate diphosphatase [Malassezia sp. CBS 17886]
MYVLPKGGVEKGESPREAAARELWEEAGVRVSLALPPWIHGEEPRSVVLDTKAHDASPTTDAERADFIPRTRYSVHEFAVAEGDMASHWLESDVRERVWLPIDHAMERLASRRTMCEVLAHTVVWGGTVAAAAAAGAAGTVAATKKDDAVRG